MAVVRAVRTRILGALRGVAIRALKPVVFRLIREYDRNRHRSHFLQWWDQHDPLRQWNEAQAWAQYIQQPRPTFDDLLRVAVAAGKVA